MPRTDGQRRERLREQLQTARAELQRLKLQQRWHEAHLVEWLAERDRQKEAVQKEAVAEALDGISLDLRAWRAKGPTAASGNTSASTSRS